MILTVLIPFSTQFPFLAPIIFFMIEREHNVNIHKHQILHLIKQLVMEVHLTPATGHSFPYS